MSLTIDDLCERSRYRRRTSHAAPARSHLTRLGPLCATLFPAGLGPRASLALRRDAGPRSSSRDGCLAEHGVGPGAAVHDRPPGPRQGSRMLLGLLLTGLVPQGATMVLGAADTVDRRSGRKRKAQGCDRAAGRSTKKPGSRCLGLQW